MNIRGYPSLCKGTGASDRLIASTCLKPYYLLQILQYFAYPYFCFWDSYFLLKFFLCSCSYKIKTLWCEIIGVPSCLWRKVSCILILMQIFMHSFCHFIFLFLGHFLVLCFLVYFLSVIIFFVCIIFHKSIFYCLIQTRFWKAVVGRNFLQLFHWK